MDGKQDDYYLLQTEELLSDSVLWKVSDQCSAMSGAGQLYLISREAW